MVTLRFFHFRAAQKRSLAAGSRVRAFGEVRAGFKGLEMIHPSYRLLSDEHETPLADRLTPVYPSTEGMGQARWIKLTDQALERLDNGSLNLQELLPKNLLRSAGKDIEVFNRISLRQALQFIHRPPPDADVAALVERRHPAQQRLALEELLAHHLSMTRIHQGRKKLGAPRMPSQSTGYETDFMKRLPFELTGAQKRVVEEIHHDMTLSHPMQRLIQGDVGSGKTVVAALASLRAIGNGHQVAITAPTELLAEQHYSSFKQWLVPLGIEPVWLSSRVTGKAREKALANIAEGTPLAIGTHALMQESVQFQNLGLVVVDEQHRFGVDQRMALLDKSKADSGRAHQLIMTATPIPRTLAMTAYAGLETSVIDELPPGRKPVSTVVISADRRGEVINRVAAACSGGRQAYWVCTLIEESDAVQARAAEDVATELENTIGNVSTGLIHGRMRAVEKQIVMDSFKAGEIQLLVATTVIEVGVDVPNASLMIIENSERLGLAQLHQLRGRVGRGAKASSCVLLYSSPIGELARKRLAIMRQTNDGFVIAEKDLELRGPGEVLGTRQTGMLQFRVADLARDEKLLDLIPDAASHILKGDQKRADKLIERWIGDSSRFAVV
ncbi:MAG TPA: ATP-dependent DNA helicase RecG, partial [Xanthomonadales bacterium]|nr:ATP-dependent DNA helicase RecG [Xanthomonadales bacterium]